MKKTALILAAGIAGLGIFWLATTSRGATEQAPYTVVRTDGSYEVRDYQELQTARVPLRDGGMDGSFGQLFRYITGANESAAKIAMTAPVLIDRTTGRETMSFILPKATAESGAPAPRGETVSLGKVPATRYAVFRFSGGRSTENEKAAREKLAAWVRAKKLEPRGEPVFAYFDPPWTPAFLRRNELMQPVAKVK